MNILIIISNPFPPVEGIGHYVYNLSKKFIEKGHDVTIITRGSLKSEKFNYHGIKVIKLPFLSIYPFHIKFHGIFVNMFLKRHENEFDLINIHTPLTPVPKAKLPIISTIHGSLIENARGINVIDLKSLANKVLTKYISRNLVQNLIDKSYIVTTVSEPVKKELMNYYDTNNITVTYNGVDENKFYPKKNEKENYLLYVGRLSYGKGLFDLIDAAENFKNEDIKFLLVGDGELKGKIKKIIAKKGLEEKIILKGQLKNEDLIEIYQKAIAFVFPSHYEGFPTVVLEAMSSGLPVILSDIESHKSIIKNNKNGFLFKKGSNKDLIEILEKIIDNEIVREKVGNCARETIKKKYTWEKVCEYYLKYLKEINRNNLN